jgi:hypothetical protein
MVSVTRSPSAFLRAFFDNRAQLGCHDNETGKSACQKDLGGVLKTAKVLAHAFADFPDDPNAKAIAARLRGLTGCDGRLRSD